MMKKDLLCGLMTTTLPNHPNGSPPSGLYPLRNVDDIGVATLLWSHSLKMKNRITFHVYDPSRNQYTQYYPYHHYLKNKR